MEAQASESGGPEVTDNAPLAHPVIAAVSGDRWLRARPATAYFDRVVTDKASTIVRVAALSWLSHRTIDILYICDVCTLQLSTF